MRIRIDRTKWDWTATGCRSVRTVMPPSTIWPMTPPTRPSDSHVRSRRRGSRTRAPSTARMTAIATMPVKRRFTCSITPWVLETSTKLLRLHSGQSGQPRPEPVRRTSAPVTMITARASAASRVKRRYVAGRSRQRRGSTPSCASSVRWTMAARVVVDPAAALRRARRETGAPSAVRGRAPRLRRCSSPATTTRSTRPPSRSPDRRRPTPTTTTATSSTAPPPTARSCSAWRSGSTRTAR